VSEDLIYKVVVVVVYIYKGPIGGYMALAPEPDTFVHFKCLPSLAVSFF
jgi:hypothetical protein